VAPTKSPGALLSGLIGQSLVYTESLAGGLFPEDDLEIRRYILLFDHLRAAALRPGQTLALLAEIAEELGKGGAG
jgi:Domain of unknown function (DUF5753)